MNQQTFFESEHALENAEVMLDLCREEYERAGRSKESQALRGLDVTSAASAQLALLTVHGLPEVAGLAEVRRYTLEAIRQARRAFDHSQLLAS
jgi:hypothetical protein